MTIGELERALSYFPKDMKVILSTDAEGNGFAPLWQALVEFIDEDGFPCDPDDAEAMGITNTAMVLWP